MTISQTFLRSVQVLLIIAVLGLFSIVVPHFVRASSLQNPEPSPKPNNAIVITKYVCPQGTSVTRAANGVGGAAPAGCVPQSGKTFGYVHGEKGDADGPYPEVGMALTPGGTTNGSGILIIPKLIPNGRYLVEETDSQNQRLPDNTVLGLYCTGDGDTSGTNDNQELTFVPEEGSTSCVAYDVADAVVTPPTSCTVVSDQTTMAGKNSAVALTFIHSAWAPGTTATPGATWIWGENPVADPTVDSTETFTKTFALTSAATGAALDLAADNNYSVTVNGHAEGTADTTGDSFAHPAHIVIPAADLVVGVNTLVVQVKNTGVAGSTFESNPAGLRFVLTNTGTSCGVVPPAPTCTADTELLTNGNFENPSVAAGDWSLFPSGTAGLGWMVSWLVPSEEQPTPANIELQHGYSGWLPSTGGLTQWAELASDWSKASTGHSSATALSQDIVTIPGKTYTFSFDYSPRPGTQSAQNKVEALAGGIVIGTSGPSAGGENTLWSKQTFTFVATSTLTHVALRDAGTPITDSLGALVDNASLKCGSAPVPPTHSEESIVVKSGDLETAPLATAVTNNSGKWFFYDDGPDAINNSLGSFVNGPATAPAGTGSSQMTLDAVHSRTDIATYAFSNVNLADITKLAFSSYSHGGIAGATESPYLVFNVSFNGTGAYQRRLVYVPSANGAVPQDAWNTNDTIQSGAGKWTWSGYAANGNKWPDGNTSEYRTWSAIIAAFPSAKVLPVGGLMGVRVGEPGPTGYTGNVDKFVIGIKTGTNTDTRTYDFEPVAALTVPACSETPSTVGLTTFDTFTLGTVNSQNGWKATGAYDQAIVANTYGYPTFGCKSLRVSDSVTSGSFGDWVFAAPAAVAAGETAPNNHYEVKFDIASAKPQALQTGLKVTLSPDDGNGSRMSYLAFTDQSDGMHVAFDDVTDTGPLGKQADFNETDIATLTRTVPHTIKLTIDFVPGAGNDVVKVYIDGALKHTGTTWEDYYRFDPEQTGNHNVLFPVDRVIIRARGPANQADAGYGFLFDNMGITTSKVVADVPVVTPPTVTAPTTTGGRSSSRRGSAGGSGGGQVLGAFTTGDAANSGQVLGESCGVYLDKNLRLGSKKNDPEQTTKLQTFLNKWITAGLSVTGTYDKKTVTAVKAFQQKYKKEILTPWNISLPTGLVYITTAHQINALECPAAAGELPPLVEWSMNPQAQI